jgi:hypothetical protein
MINPAQLSLIQPDGETRKVIIGPVLKKDGADNLQNTGIYKIYKDAFGDETVLFTEPREFDEARIDLPDENNPDYLGKISILNSVEWQYEGDLLSADEQLQVLKYIKN